MDNSLPAPIPDQEETDTSAQNEKKKKKAKKVKKEGGKKLEALYRTASRNHISMSAIADRKANILLSVSSILSSVTFSFLVRHVETEPAYALPGIMLIAICTCTIITAILSTRPTIGNGRFTREEVKAKEANLMFFGNYYNMPLAEYEWGLQQLECDKEYIEKLMAKDFYSLGIVLAKKYRYLRISYNIFMFGTVASVITGYITFEYHLKWFTELWK